MSESIQLTEALLSKLGGWEAMKQARSLVAAGKVQSSEWQSPKLQGVVQEGSSTYNAGLAIRSASDADNLCPCRTSRQRGLICAHSIAVGLHFLSPPIAPMRSIEPIRETIASPSPAKKARALVRSETGTPLELSFILPPNLGDVIARGKIMLCVEARGRGPLAGLPLDAPVFLSASDEAILGKVERWNQGDTPSMLILDGNQFAEVLPMLATHERVTLGRSQPFRCVIDTIKPKFKLNLAGGLAVLQAKLECYYGVRSVADLPPGLVWLVQGGSPLRFATRDLAAEQAALSALSAAGFTGPDRENAYHMRGQEAVLGFFARHYPKFQREWEVTLEERLEKSAQSLERVEPRFEILPSGEQWFDLHVTFSTSGGERFSQADIQKLLRSRQSHTKLGNGKIAILDTGAVEELEQVLVDASPRQQAGAYRLHNAQAGFLDATLGQQLDWKVQAPAEWRHRAGAQRGEIKLEPPALGELESVLRPYQKEGVAWLQFLRENRFGGVLADEMGLGKTLQVLAFLSAIKAKPSLVVCPTSLVFNWEAEAAKFTPHLKVLALHGPKRAERFAEMAAHDVIITSYALIRRDAEHYRDLQFDTIILDEAQHIKNRQTQNAQAVKAVWARNKVVLTGTPIENSVLDLWSIFDFLMPGYLGTAADFRERYELAITRDKDKKAQQRLARRLRPFLLRRLKRDVAADLPEKIEQVSYCELSEEQRALYQQVLEAGRREMLNATDGPSQAKSRMMVLTALLRLRQICCDARLLNLESTKAAVSGKTELFLELLEEAIDGGHRVLVFSQFTSMLALLKEALTEQKIDFCYLDGSTRDRPQVVEKFQTNESIPVFLISLKAGGVGLNLTGADTVVHFDPWWNPAVEAQATDRAHRIGQRKIVTSYKLITRGTVEEKILTLQQRKRALTQAMLGDEDEFVQSLSWEEIQQLLEP